MLALVVMGLIPLADFLQAFSIPVLEANSTEFDATTRFLAANFTRTVEHSCHKPR